MIYENLENDLLAFLAAKFGSDIEVELMPEDQKDYIKPFAKCKVSICYKMSSYAKPKSTSHTVQEEDMQVEFVIRCRRLRGVNQLWDTQRRVALALIGAEPRDCRRLYAINFQFESREDAIFSYVYTMGVGTEVVMDFDETAGLETINSITVAPTDPGYGPGVTVTN